MTGARRPAAAKTAARAGHVRRSTPAELAADVDDGQAAADVGDAAEVEQFDPDVDFDLGSWRAQRTEAERESVKFRLDDRRPLPAGVKDTGPRFFVVDIPLLSQWEAEALEALETQTVRGMIDSIAMVVDDPAGVRGVLAKLTGDELGAVVRHLTSVSGVTPGESGPSGASSRRIPRR